MSDAGPSPQSASPGGDPAVVDGYLVRLNGGAWGLAFGLLLGVGLFLATVVLVLRGGEDVGPHLRLLDQYLPFYSVSYAGAAVGFVDAFVLGYAIGRTLCAVYNRAARR